jgi:hypothetical protein
MEAGAGIDSMEKESTQQKAWKEAEQSGFAAIKIRLLRMSRLAAFVLFSAGALLMAINVTGLFLSLRNPRLQSEKTLFKNDIIITPPRLWEDIRRRSGETAEEYVRRLNSVVAQAMAHEWADRSIDEYHLRVPIWENYILYFMSYAMPRPFLKYEFADYEKALERGVGLCSQHALVLTEILREEGIEAQVIALDGHVVARVEVEKGEWIIADPDYGVVIPHDILKVQNGPEMVLPYYIVATKNYRPGGKGHSAEKIAAIYGRENNYILEEGAKGYMGAARYNFEKNSYRVKWLLPAALMLPALVLLSARAFRRYRT